MHYSVRNRNCHKHECITKLLGFFVLQCHYRCWSWVRTNQNMWVTMATTKVGISVIMSHILVSHIYIAKSSDTGKVCCSHPKIWTRRLYHRVMHPKDADGIANSVDSPLGAVWSGSALFALTYLSENLGSLWYSVKILKLRTPEEIAVIILKIEQYDFTLEQCIWKMQ